MAFIGYENNGLLACFNEAFGRPSVVLDEEYFKAAMNFVAVLSCVLGVEVFA